MTLLKIMLKGGKGSGNFGHLGRPGMVGGSGPGKASGAGKKSAQGTINTAPRNVETPKELQLASGLSLEDVRDDPEMRKRMEDAVMQVGEEMYGKGYIAAPGMALGEVDPYQRVAQMVSQDGEDDWLAGTVDGSNTEEYFVDGMDVPGYYSMSVVFDPSGKSDPEAFMDGTENFTWNDVNAFYAENPGKVLLTQYSESDQVALMQPAKFDRAYMDTVLKYDNAERIYDKVFKTDVKLGVQKAKPAKKAKQLGAYDHEFMQNIAPSAVNEQRIADMRKIAKKKWGGGAASSKKTIRQYLAANNELEYLSEDDEGYEPWIPYSN